MVYTLRFFSSKCSLFHNSNVFGSCIINILYTGCAKIKKIIPAPNFKYNSDQVCSQWGAASGDAASGCGAQWAAT